MILCTIGVTTAFFPMNNEALSDLKGGQDSGLTEANRKMGTKYSLPIAKFLIPLK